ncbi:hypothetical protein WB401_03130 [Streptomyces brasiliscabiei]|uniref:Integral membrane protein n=1 Tax=Streptomyces brasiliscabiei TaxID=2736302 RepID=A0ABU8GIN6_9ACTN
MTTAVVLLLVFAGLSEAAGRIVPLVSRRPGMSRTFVAGLLVAAGLVEGAVLALWPLTAWTLAELLPSAPPPESGLSWTPSLLVPLLLSAVLAFPLLGPLLHLVLFVGVGVGAGLAGSLATASGLGWWTAAGCVAVAGTGLGVTVEAVRRLVVRVSATRTPEVTV